MRLAIIRKEKCKPLMCAHECKKYCPIEKAETDSCVVIGAKAVIDEKTCIGCSICVKRCPFGAIEIVNLPSVSESDMVHRYGTNGFALYGLPIPREGKVLGLLGRNGIGKSTAISLLAGHETMNLGKSSASVEDIKEHFKGNEILRYVETLKDKKIAYKPQNLAKLAANLPVKDLLHKLGESGKVRQLAEHLGIARLLDNRLDKLSGGELQKVAIIAASLADADIYFFDEPLAYLDIAERLKVSDFIRDIARDKTVIVVEHDLLLLDYLTDYVQIFYGLQGVFGTVSGIKSSKYGVNAYLHGFLKEENLRIRDKELNFNFTKNSLLAGNAIAHWPDFSIAFDQGFALNVPSGKIHENHVIGILGKNGTGKTTLVKALAGELEVEHNGKKQKLDLGLDIAYKPQYLFTESEELVRDIMFKEKVNKKMATVFNLGVLQSKKLKELSGGELQRFSIARCLSKDADVYLIDEPSAYLDVEERISVAKAIKDAMIEKAKTAFVVDHDLLVVSYLADAIINMDGESGKHATASPIKGFEEGITTLLKSLDVTLRKDEESGRPRINTRGSVLDREQKENDEWAVF